MAADRMTAAGDRRALVRIEQLTQPDEAGTAGESVERWTLLENVYMQKVDATGVEQFRADQLSARYDTRWVMPFVASMDPDVVDVQKTRRLVFKGRYYDITSAALIGSHEGIALMTVTASRVTA